MITFPEIEKGTGPILMLNLLKFKDRKLYFEKYIPAFYEVMKGLGIHEAKISLTGDVLANIVVSEGENWEAIVLVEYPSAAAFKSMAVSEHYQTFAEPLRLASVEDVKLIMTRKIEN